MAKIVGELKFIVFFCLYIVCNPSIIRRIFQLAIISYYNLFQYF